MVFATQNPIEQEGTYPLPEAQLDRFMFNLVVDYPQRDVEFEIVKKTTRPQKTELSPILSAEDIVRLQDMVMRVPVEDSIIQYAVDLVRKTRVKDPSAPEDVKRFLSWGAGPRASQYLILASKARAALDGRRTIDKQDVQALAHPILRHRIITNFQADAQRITPDDIISRLIETT